MEQLPAVSEMVPRDSLQLMEAEEGPYQLLSFTPHVKLPIIGDIAKKLVGRIWFHKEQGFIERVMVQNEAKLTPVPGLSIKELHLGMRFGQTVDAQGHQQVVLLESELMVIGKKLFKSFQQISHYQYSDHVLPAP